MTGLIWLALVGQATAGPMREPVMAMLNGTETSVTAADVQALGEGATAELLEISKDPTVPPTRRARAITALRYVRMTPEVEQTLERHLDESESLLRRKAALSLATVGQSAIARLSSALESADIHLRMAAARALGQIGSDQARTAIEQRLTTETEPVAQEALRDALEAK